MAKIKPKQACAKAIAEGFSGIGEEAANSIRTADIRNFRIRSDGSLQKRCGWRVTHTLPDTVRAYWSGSINGSPFQFAVCADKVYRLYGESVLPIATISKSNESPQFFLYRNHLYLLNGKSIYVYNAEEELLELSQGYAPLYGYNWHPTKLGEVNEPMNLLSDQLRVHYFNSTATTDFKLPFYSCNVVGVRVDGRYVSDFYLLEDDRTLYVGDASDGSSIEVAFTVSTDTVLRNSLCKCTSVFYDNEKGEESLILYGAPNSNLVFCNTKVTDPSSMALAQSSSKATRCISRQTRFCHWEARKSRSAQSIATADDCLRFMKTGAFRSPNQPREIL